MRKIVLFSIAAVFAVSCSNTTNAPGESAQQDNNRVTKQNETVIENNMENAFSMVPSWINEVTVVKMDDPKAHSGEFASRIDDQALYSYTYRERFENINQKLPVRVVVNGWYYFAEPNPKASIVMDINENNVSVLWKAFNLNTVNPATNQWNEFTAYFTIDLPIKPEYQIKIFGYSGKKLMYLDDLKITFEY